MLETMQALAPRKVQPCRSEARRDARSDMR
jgi:hypothetical protein